MSTLERLFGYALLVGAVVYLGSVLRTWRRGWIIDEDDEKIVRSADHPRSWIFMQLLQIAGVVILVISGLGVLGIWKWS